MNIKEVIKEYLRKEILDANTIENLTSTSSLQEEGLIDSITTLQLVDFLEKEFNIEFQAHEVNKDNLDTLERIEIFIKSKV